jgi:ComF family protein
MTAWRDMMAAALRAAGGGVLDVVFPRWCLGCGGLVETGPLEHLCERCLETVPFVRRPHCSGCGQPFFGEVAGLRRCPHCVELEPEFDEGRTGMMLEGVARQFVHELKYRQGRHLRKDLPKLLRLAPVVTEFVRGAVLVPVPLHPRRLRWRGFNQARWVAEALAAEGGAAGIQGLLVRVRDTQTQTRLDRAKRELNMKGAFALRSGSVVVSTVRYIIVDDVYTTGATLNACAEVLRKAGAEEVDVASLGHG